MFDDHSVSRGRAHLPAQYISGNHQYKYTVTSYKKYGQLFRFWYHEKLVFITQVGVQNDWLNKRFSTFKNKYKKMATKQIKYSLPKFETWVVSERMSDSLRIELYIRLCDGVLSLCNNEQSESSCKLILQSGSVSDGNIPTRVLVECESGRLSFDCTSQKEKIQGKTYWNVVANGLLNNSIQQEEC